MPEQKSIINPVEIRVIVVDDNRTDREYSTAVLKKIGFREVDMATSGDDAISKCAENKYDVIFMDLSMPDISGYDASMAIRKLGRGSSDSRIVALTSSVCSAEEVRKCLEKGMSDLIAKPLKEEILKKRMLRWR